MAGILRNGDFEPSPDHPNPGSIHLTKMMFVNEEGGERGKWQGPVTLIDPNVGRGEESYFCELQNGDLFWMHRTVSPTRRSEFWMQSVVEKPSSHPNDPHWWRHVEGTLRPFDGPGEIEFPALVNAVVPGSGRRIILFLTKSAIYWTEDVTVLGKPSTEVGNEETQPPNGWRILNGPDEKSPCIPYHYPCVMQTKSSEIICAGHLGGDYYPDPMKDPAIHLVRFRLGTASGH